VVPILPTASNLLSFLLCRGCTRNRVAVSEAELADGLFPQEKGHLTPPIEVTPPLFLLESWIARFPERIARPVRPAMTAGLIIFFLLYKIFRPIGVASTQHFKSHIGSGFGFLSNLPF
jgi:hypothetical protein